MSTLSRHWPHALAAPARRTRSASHQSSRRPSDPTAQNRFAKIHAFCRYERRRQPQTLHMLIATGQYCTKLPNGEAKQLFPLCDKGSIGKLDRSSDKRDFRSIDQRWIASKQPRNQPMHDQLRCVIDHFWVERGHTMILTLSREAYCG